MLYIGGIVALGLLACFTFMNLAFNFKITSNTLLGDGDFLAMYLWSSLTAYVNTLTMFTFLFVVVGLFEFALSFVYVCYYYDNCSWETVKICRNAWNQFVEFMTRKPKPDLREIEQLKYDIAKIKSEQPKLIDTE